MSFEFPLVIFTVFTQLGVGVALFAWWDMLVTPEEAHTKTVRMRVWFCAFVASFVGLAASLFHLGHPLAAYKALYNLGDSWLSREGLIFGCFCGLAFINIWLR